MAILIAPCVRFSGLQTTPLNEDAATTSTSQPSMVTMATSPKEISPPGFLNGGPRVITLSQNRAGGIGFSVNLELGDWRRSCLTTLDRSALDRIGLPDSLRMILSGNTEVTRLDLVRGSLLYPDPNNTTIMASLGHWSTIEQSAINDVRVTLKLTDTLRQTHILRAQDMDGLQVNVADAPKPDDAFYPVDRPVVSVKPFEDIQEFETLILWEGIWLDTRTVRPSNNGGTLVELLRAITDLRTGITDRDQDTGDIILPDGQGGSCVVASWDSDGCYATEKELSVSFLLPAAGDPEGEFTVQVSADDLKQYDFDSSDNICGKFDRCIDLRAARQQLPGWHELRGEGLNSPTDVSRVISLPQDVRHQISFVIDLELEGWRCSRAVTLAMPLPEGISLPVVLRQIVAGHTPLTHIDAPKGALYWPHPERQGFCVWLGKWQTAERSAVADLLVSVELTDANDRPQTIRLQDLDNLDFEIAASEESDALHADAGRMVVQLQPLASIKQFIADIAWGGYWFADRLVTITDQRAKLADLLQAINDGSTGITNHRHFSGDIVLPDPAGGSFIAARWETTAYSTEACPEVDIELSLPLPDDMPGEYGVTIYHGELNNIQLHEVRQD